VLPEIFVLADLKERERLGQFNERAARGEFIPEESLAFSSRIRFANRLRDFVASIRNPWSGAPVTRSA
jgi:hypothetical protein